MSYSAANWDNLDWNASNPHAGTGVVDEAASRQHNNDAEDAQERQGNLEAAATLVQAAAMLGSSGTSCAVSKESEDSRGKKRRPPALSLA